jgi:hypothetical protein
MAAIKSEAEPMEIAMSFIIHGGDLFFEQREKDTANGALGKIGCWGGQLNYDEEKGRMETSIEAVHREVTKEEVKGLENFTQEHFTQLSHEPIEVMSDRDDKPLPIKAHVFSLLLPIGYKDRITAPNSVWLNAEQLNEALDGGKLTPATERASIDFLGLMKMEGTHGFIDN